ncbi:hypothetical protein BG006_009576, partial [Podila minutissima]
GDNQHRENDNENNSNDLDGVSSRNDDSNGGFVSISPNRAIIAGSVAGALLLACVILGLVLLHKRQARKRSKALETYFSCKNEVHLMSPSGVCRSNSNGSNGSFDQGSGEINRGTFENIGDHTRTTPQPNNFETERPLSVAPMSSIMLDLIPTKPARLDCHFTDRRQDAPQFHSMEDKDFETLAHYSRGYTDPITTTSTPSNSSTPELHQPPLIHRPSRASYEQDFYPESLFHPVAPHRFNNLDPLAEVEETPEIVSEPSSGSSPIINEDSFPVPPSIPVLYSPATLSPPPRDLNNPSNAFQGFLETSNTALMVRLASESRALIRNDPGLRTTFQPVSMSEPMLSRSSSVESTMTMEQRRCEANHKRISVYDGDGLRLQVKRAGSLLFS